MLVYFLYKVILMIVRKILMIVILTCAERGFRGGASLFENSLIIKEREKTRADYVLAQSKETKDLDSRSKPSQNPEKKMVFYMLFISAELENLTNLQPLGGCDDPNYRYYFKVKCENCGEISQKETCVTLSETVPLSSGRATANLVQKCKLCGREGSIQMVTGQGQPLTLGQSQAESFSPLMVFDCRGFEPIGFSFGNGWKAESTSGTVFEIDLSEGEFGDYDEKEGCPVGISNLREHFKVVKKNDRHGRTSYYS